MATIRFTATISGEFDSDIDVEEITLSHLRDELAFDVDSVDEAELVN